MDLSKLKVEKKEGRELALEDPRTGKPLLGEDGRPLIVITLLSQDSDKARKARHKINNEKLLPDFNRGRRPKTTSESLTEDATRVLADLTVSWAGVELDGAPLECNAENAFRVYTEFEWIREQVDAFTSDRARFLGNS